MVFFKMWLSALSWWNFTLYESLGIKKWNFFSKDRTWNILLTVFRVYFNIFSILLIFISHCKRTLQQSKIPYWNCLCIEETRVLSFFFFLFVFDSKKNPPFLFPSHLGKLMLERSLCICIYLLLNSFHAKFYKIFCFSHMSWQKLMNIMFFSLSKLKILVYYIIYCCYRCI